MPVVLRLIVAPGAVSNGGGQHATWALTNPTTVTTLNNVILLGPGFFVSL